MSCEVPVNGDSQPPTEESLGPAPDTVELATAKCDPIPDAVQEVLIQIPEVLVLMPEAPAQMVEAPARIPEVLEQTPDVPVQTPDVPVQTPDVPVQTPDAPVPTPDVPVQTLDVPDKTVDVPVGTACIPLDTPEISLPLLEVPMAVPTPAPAIAALPKVDTNAESPKTPQPRCISRAPRKPAYTSNLITQADIAQEILARAEKKRQTFPDAVDVLVAMKSPSKIRIPMEVKPQTTSPPKLPKLRDENKCLDAKDLLLILQDGSDADQKKSPTKCRVTRAKLDLRIDPELERQLALKQLMEFSKKTERRPRNSNNNVDGAGEKVKIKQEGKIKPETKIKQEGKKEIKQEKDAGKDEPKETKKQRKPKKRAAASTNGPPPKRGSNRELQRLLQDEGAINMLYDVEKGDSAETKDRLSSKRRLKKVLKKKAQEVEEAILVASGSKGSHRSLRTSDKRKQSVESAEAEAEVKQEPVEMMESQETLETPGAPFTFPAPAEASKIIRRHSSSSSYSSRGSSPRRMSVDRDRSPSSSEAQTPTNSKTDLSSLSSSLAEIQNAQLGSSSDVSDQKPNSSPIDMPPVKSKALLSDKTEKLIEMKVRELNLQPCHGTLIKRLIVDRKNGLKERLRSEFKVKFKAALPQENSHGESSTSKAPGVKLNVQALEQLKAKTKTLVSGLDAFIPSSPSKPAWKMVEEDWDTGDEADPDNPPPIKTEKTAKLEKRRQSQSKSVESDIQTIAETLVARIKAGMPVPQVTCSGSPAGSLTSRLPSKEGTVPSDSSLGINKSELCYDQNLRSVVHDGGHTSPLPDTDDIAELTSLPQAVEGPTPGSDVRLERMNAIIRLYIKPTSCRLPNSLSSKVMNELTQALTYLETSSDTRVIVLVFPPLHEAMAAISESENDPDYRDVLPDFCAGRTSPAFRSGQNIIEVLPTDQVNHCNGIDLLALCADSADERRQAASQTATAIKDLTHKLATCSRLVCTAVSGKAIGLSVVLLAYCDFVLADETAVFFTPYAQLGYLPEAAATHTLPHVIGRRKTSWLLLGNGTLSASEAEVCGLVTRVVHRRSHLAHELNNLARSLAATSMLASESAKGMMNSNIRSTISNSLSVEAKVLETHWSAPDTQHRMKNFAVQLILDMHKAQWKERESRMKESSEVQIQRSALTHDPTAAPEEFEVPPQQLVFEEPSDQLDIEPLQPIDELHFEDPTITLELPMPAEGSDYQLQQLR